VQKEFAEERRLLKRYIAKNPAYRRFFDTFVFEEDVVAADRRTDEVYLEELGASQVRRMANVRAVQADQGSPHHNRDVI